MSFSEFYKAQRANLPIPPASAIGGGTYIVTGAGHGLGLACSQHLVRLGAKRVILAVRSVQRGEAAKTSIEKETGRTGVAAIWTLDLASYESVKSFVARALQELDRIDGLIENASAALDTWTVSEGLETHLTVNVVSTFLLALLLFPKMEDTAEKFTTLPHLVIVTSGLAFSQYKDFQKFSRKSGDVLDMLNIEGDWTVAGTARYGTSKLIQIFAFKELSAILPVSQTGVVINIISPGLCNTDLARYAKSFFTRLQINLFSAILGRTPEMGSRTILHAATAGKVSHGQYLSDCEIKPHHVPDWVTNSAGREVQRRVWDGLKQRLAAIDPNAVRLVHK